MNNLKNKIVEKIVMNSFQIINSSTAKCLEGGSKNFGTADGEAEPLTRGWAPGVRVKGSWCPQNQHLSRWLAAGQIPSLASCSSPLAPQCTEQGVLRGAGYELEVGTCFGQPTAGLGARPERTWPWLMQLN